MSIFISYIHLERLSSSLYKLPWSQSTILMVACHVIKFINLDEYDRWDCTIRHLNLLAIRWDSLQFNIFKGNGNMKKMEVEKACAEREIWGIFRNYFIPEVRRFFNVPKLQQLPYKYYRPLKRYEHLAGFIILLLHILDSEKPLWSSYRKHPYALLQKNLTFLLTALGDTPLWWCSEHEDVTSLLLEFESLAIEAGNFIYSCTFASRKLRKKRFDMGIQTLFRKTNAFVNEKLRKHVFNLSGLPKTETSRSNLSLSPFIVDSLLDDLEGLPFDDVKGQIRPIIEELAFIQNVLKNCQLPHFKHINELQESLLRIREVAYEAEYLIKSHLIELTPPWYLNFRLSNIVQKVRLTAKEAQETKRINDVEGINIKNRYSSRVSNETVRNTEVVVENIVIGFEDNRTKILADLTGRSEELMKISIHGMPGIGKTTLAKKLYNDRAVYDHFDLRIWCIVSQSYEKEKMLIDIWTSLALMLGKDKVTQKGEEILGLEIYHSLYGRRYLIIMDDVWCPSVWDDMKIYFPDDRNGSRILFTSRIKDAAPTGSIYHEPQLLSDDQSYDLLLKKIFVKEPCPPKLLVIAKRIASKCHGLPLAVVVVSGIMANLGEEESAWNRVEANLNLFITEDQTKYQQILELSYKHLPDHLRPCFLYLGIFLEDEELPRRKVIALWIAEGFVMKKDEKSLEDIAEEYYSDLINRSLLMIATRKSDGGIKACRIHDLLRDMCLRIAEEENFLMHISESSTYEQHSHLVLPGSSRETFAAPHCRSLRGHFLFPGYHMTHMPLLRVIDGLHIDSSSPQYVTDRISSLIHLKYLSLSANEFPLVLSRLGNLEYLRLQTNFRVIVPSTILKMVKLRHICITTAAVFEKSSNSSRTMNNLESLSCCIIGDEEDNIILKCSPFLHKLKCLCTRSFFPDLISLTELQSLTMKFTSPPKGELREGYFPLTIKRLSLYRTSLPWEKMTVVGSLPNLQVLKLRCCAFNGDEWDMTYGEFQELRYLKLSDISLKQWNVCSEHFPRLRCLVLEYVRNLVEIPCDLGNIPTLERIEVRHCRYGVERSVLQMEEEQRDYGNEDLKVIITSDKQSKDENSTEDEDDVSETGLSPKVIKMVMATSSWVSRARAVKALKDADGNFGVALSKLR